jgi:hypothetical protein
MKPLLWHSQKYMHTLPRNIAPCDIQFAEQV